MRITANIATYKPRLDSGSLYKMLDSIYGQFDMIRIYFNDCEPDLDKLALHIKSHQKIDILGNMNLTDNGKFFALDEIIKTPEYYFTLDDDLIYPPNYVSKTIEAIEKYGCIITHHGRQLQGTFLDYYTMHKTFRCLNDVHSAEIVDVCGTGVTAFRTDYFHPKGLAFDKRLRMSDLIFSLEASKQKKTIGVVPHECGWIKPIMNKESIFDTESLKGNAVQNGIANEIYLLNHGNK